MVWGEKFLGVGSWGWRWVCGLEIEVGVRVRGLTPSVRVKPSYILRFPGIMEFSLYAASSC